MGPRLDAKQRLARALAGAGLEDPHRHPARPRGGSGSGRAPRSGATNGVRAAAGLGSRASRRISRPGPSAAPARARPPQREK